MPDAHPMSGQRYHLLGVAGRGMAPLGVVARHLGAEVSGCDRGGDEDVRAWLRSHDFDFVTGHSPRHVRRGTQLVATAAVAAEEPELRAAAEVGTVWHRTDLLAEVLRQRRCAGISGSHGKGSVTAFATAALEHSGCDPLGILGVLAPDLGGYARLGRGPIVAEVDDSDHTLVRVGTDVAVVTNLDDDHPRIATTLEHAVESVGQFVARAADRVLLGPSRRAARLASYARAEVWQYGRELRVRTLERDATGSTIELRAPGGVREQARLRFVGARLDVNAALGFATALSLGADPSAAAEGLAQIGGLSRRLELVGSREGVRVFDDFGGKHPACVRAGLETVRRHFPGSDVVAVFEPLAPNLARWGWRYARALGAADRVVFVTPVASRDFGPGAAFDPGWHDGCGVPHVAGVERSGAADVALGMASPGDIVVFFAQQNSARAMAEHAVSVGVTG